MEEKTYSLSDIQKAFFPNKSLEELLVYQSYNYSLSEIKEMFEKKSDELLPCPNPECKEDGTYIKQENAVPDGKLYWVICPNCRYHSPVASTAEEAKRLHNLIADNSRRNGEE